MQGPQFGSEAQKQAKAEGEQAMTRDSRGRFRPERESLRYRLLHERLEYEVRGNCAVFGMEFGRTQPNKQERKRATSDEFRRTGGK